MAEQWSDQELSASVEAYRQMQANDRSGTPYSKREVYAELSARFGRSSKAFEYRMQNISAVLDSRGEPWIDGLKPAKNVGAATARRIERFLTPQEAEPAYRAKLPSMRAWLIEVARLRMHATYGAVMAAFNIDRHSLNAALSRLGQQSKALEEPIITALVVSKDTLRCSAGLEKEFGIADDEAERERLYAYWEKRAADPPPPEPPDDALQERAARFARVKVRPDQVKFRKGVFLACDGRCVLSGCDIREALDAAHRAGRSWQKGHNRASDGFLLRKDLHALYDAGKLRIDREGQIDLDEQVTKNYPELIGRRLVSVAEQESRRPK